MVARMLNRNLVFCLILTVLSGCVDGINLDRTKDDVQAAMGWDARPEAAAWTGATLAAVARYDSVLAGSVDRKSTRLNSSHVLRSRMPSSA